VGLLAGAAVSGQAQAAGPTAKLDAGVVEGAAGGELMVFKGIPYAATCTDRRQGRDELRTGPSAHRPAHGARREDRGRRGGHGDQGLGRGALEPDGGQAAAGLSKI
jgi:hypothetical protein